jgi:hypothetical protein
VSDVTIKGNSFAERSDSSFQSPWNKIIWLGLTLVPFWKGDTASSSYNQYSMLFLNNLRGYLINYGCVVILECNFSYGIDKEIIHPSAKNKAPTCPWPHPRSSTLVTPSNIDLSRSSRCLINQTVPSHICIPPS